ncbi:MULTISPECIES: acyl carrier protein [Chitinophagaceae]
MSTDKNIRTDKKETVVSSGNKKKTSNLPGKTSDTPPPYPYTYSAPSPFSQIASEALQDGVRNTLRNTAEYNKDVIQKLKAIVAQYTETPELLDNIESGTDESFIEKLNIDSVDFVEIIVDAEEAFDIKIEDDEIKSLKSFDDLYYLIANKTGNRHSTKKNLSSGSVTVRSNEVTINKPDSTSFQPHKATKKRT